MNTKLKLLSLVTGAMLTGSLAIAAQGDGQPRAKSHARVAKPTAVTSTRVSGNTGAMRTRERFVSGRSSAGTGTRERFLSGRNSATIGTRERFVSGRDSTRFGTRNRVVVRSGYPYRTYGYRTYSYGYPYYSYGYGYPYYGYYPYDYYDGGYPYNYSYGYYYSQPGYSTYANGSVVIAVQTRLARAGYYHGVIDGSMGPRTRYAIQVYERDHGLRVDGTISGPLLRNMGLRY